MEIKKMMEMAEKTKSFQNWTKNHDTFEQVAILKQWADFEEYDIVCRAKNPAELFAVFCFTNFVIEVEFIDQVRGAAENYGGEWDEADVKNAKFLLKELGY